MLTPAALQRDLSQEAIIGRDFDDSMNPLKRGGPRGQSQVIKTKGPQSSGARSAVPQRQNLIPALNEDENIIKTEDDYGEDPIGGEFGSMNMNRESPTAVIKRNLGA